MGCNMNNQIRELLLKMTDFRQEVTHPDRVLLANEVSRLYGELQELKGIGRSRTSHVQD